MIISNSGVRDGHAILLPLRHFGLCSKHKQLCAFSIVRAAHTFIQCCLARIQVVQQLLDCACLPACMCRGCSHCFFAQQAIIESITFFAWCCSHHFLAQGFIESITVLAFGGCLCVTVHESVAITHLSVLVLSPSHRQKNGLIEPGLIIAFSPCSARPPGCGRVG